MLTAVVDDPHGYGRIVRDGESHRRHRRGEGRDAGPSDGSRRSTAASTRSSWSRCSRRWQSIGADNAQGEYYLPDLVRIYRKRGLVVETVTARRRAGDPGVNSRRELADVSAILKQDRNEELMAAGVTIVDPASTWIGPDVTVGADTVLHPNVFLEGRTRDRLRLCRSTRASGSSTRRSTTAS